MTRETLSLPELRYLTDEQGLRLYCLMVARALRLLDAHLRGERLEGRLLDGADGPGDDLLVGEAASHTRGMPPGTRRFTGHEEPIYTAGIIRGMDSRAVDGLPGEVWDAYQVLGDATHAWSTTAQLDAMPDPGPLDEGGPYTLREVTLEEMKARLRPEVRARAEARAAEIRADLQDRDDVSCPPGQG